MKKHLVVICGVLYPDPTATGICTKGYVDLISDEFDIDIICIASDMNDAHVTESSGVRIHALAGGMMKIEAQKKGFGKYITHKIGQIQIKLDLLGNLKWYSYAALEKMYEINRIRKIDSIFSVCSPISAHVAANAFKKRYPDVNWVAYTVDLFAVPERIKPIGYSFKKLKKVELDLLKQADSVLLSEEIYQNHPEMVKTYSRVNALPYLMPDLHLAEESNGWFDHSQINCVYIGSFYEDIRNPRVMLDAFSKIKNNKIKLHLFSTGAEELVRSYSELCSNIIVHGKIAHEVISEIYSESDILVNIGNKNSDFIPSKTFEYISTGKPIVNFYYGEKPDAVITKYPIVFQLSNELILADVQRLSGFIETNNNVVLVRSRLDDLYKKHTRKNIKSILINAI